MGGPVLIAERESGSRGLILRLHLSTLCHSPRECLSPLDAFGTWLQRQREAGVNTTPESQKEGTPDCPRGCGCSKALPAKPEESWASPCLCLGRDVKGSVPGEQWEPTAASLCAAT